MSKKNERCLGGNMIKVIAFDLVGVLVKEKNINGNIIHKNIKNY